MFLIHNTQFVIIGMAYKYIDVKTFKVTDNFLLHTFWTTKLSN